MTSTNSGRFALEDDEFDSTTVDTTGSDYLSLIQTDEAGVEHIVLLSPQMASDLLPMMDLWLRKNLTTEHLASLCQQMAA